MRMRMRMGLEIGRPGNRWWPALAVLIAAVGCAHEGADREAVDARPKAVPVTVTDLKHRPVERTVDVVGTLRGWEEVTVGSKKAGRVIQVRHDMGDRINPDEPLVKLDPTDADLAVQQAESKLMGNLVRLGVTRPKAEAYLSKYGTDEQLLQSDETDRLIKANPAIVQAKVAVEKAQQNFQRQRQVTQRGAGTYQDFQNAENDLKAAEAAYDNAILTARMIIADALTSRVALAQAKQAVTDTLILAPRPSALPEGHAGQVVYALTKRQASEGQMIKEGEAVAELVIEDPLKLRTNVPERFSAEVRVGQPVRFTVMARPGETFEGRVTRINPAVDPVSRTFQVEAQVPNSKGLLRPGGFAKASILTHQDDRATVVPIESVVRFAGVTKVFVVEGDKARSFSVRTGLEGPGWVEVTGDLPSRGRVITSGMTQLADGTPITIRKPEAEPAPARAAGAARAGM